MASIQLNDVTKTFKTTTAIDNLSLEIQDGEFFCILGPPGAGKTTLLRLIVGLEKPDKGEILIEGESVIGIHPSQRDISMIFQNLALYPDKTVFDNIAFPLRQQKLPEDQIMEKVESVAKQLKIDWLLKKIPSKLSGGERQRVAIGRAIVRQPKAYLMDEPLSNLDAMLRLEMRVSLKELQTNLKETFVYVTHDQEEAMTIADRIVIMNNGKIQQIGSPKEIYAHPVNRFVADFIGKANFLEGRVTGKIEKDRIEVEIMGQKIMAPNPTRSFSEGDRVLIVARSESIELGEKTSKETLTGTIQETVYLGAEMIYEIKLGSTVLIVDLPNPI